MTYYCVRLEFACVYNAPLESGLGNCIVNKVELCIGS